MKNEEFECESKLKILEENIDSETDNNKIKDLEKQWREVKTRLTEIDDYRIKGLILRSRCEWYEKGEKSNKFFLSLATRNKVKSSMNMLKIEGDLVTDSQAILNAQSDFYANLYTDKSKETYTNIEEYFKGIDLPKLCDEDKESCEGMIKEEECRKVIKTMKRDKSPGNDGLSVEFYEKFWGVLCRHFLEAMNESYQREELSPSQRQAVITLIDKGSDRTLLKNWRPISLLNIDYKIASKVLASRLKEVLPKIIHENQAGYVKGRSILDNIRTISDIMHYTKVNNIPGILLAIDFQKAFDSVSWRFLEITLQKFNLGNSFRKWIKLLYNKISSCVINKGITSKYFPVTQGVRQGDPLSPYLFVLIAEVLANKIRMDDRIKGIKLGEVSNKVLQFADDTNGLLADIDSANHFIETVKIFGKYSNLLLNKEKTQGMWLGKDRQNREKPLEISWPDKPVKLLGVYMSYDVEACNKLNYDKKLVKCKNILNWWKSRNLTIIGRIQVIKTFVISQFLFVSSVIDMPDNYIKEVNKMIKYFVWKGKSKLKSSIMYREKVKGGLKMPDFKTMIIASRIKWINRLIGNKGKTCWVNLQECMKLSGIENMELFLEANYEMKRLKDIRNIPRFYVKALTMWGDYIETENGRSNIIWYNKKIIVDRRSVYYKDFYEAGIIYIKDVFDKEGKPKSFRGLVEKGIHKGKWLRWQSLTSNFNKTALEMQEVCEKDQVNGTFVIGQKQKLSKITSSLLYELLLKKQYNTNEIASPNIVQFLEPNRVEDIFPVFNRIYKCTRSSKLQEFQYKFLYNIHVNNYWLKIWRISNDDYCTLCQEQVETLDHMIWKCKNVLDFWEELKGFIKTKFNRILMKQDIYLGTDDNLLCMIITMAKQFVYNNNRKGINPKFKLFLNR